MKTCFYIVSFRRDWEMLAYCARSINKFARGEYELRIGVPNADRDFFYERLPSDCTTQRYFHFDEPAGAGFNAQQCVKCEADKYAPGFDNYIHVDSDSLFLRPFNITELFHRPGRPVWYYGEYAKLINPQTWPLRNWQAAVREAIGTAPLREYMRKFPIVIPASVYPDMRKIVEHKHKKPFGQYVFSCKSSFPQTFAEFNTLGFVADINGHNVEFVNWEKAKGWDLLGQFHGPGGPDFVFPHGGMAGYTMRRKAQELGLT